MMRGDVLVAESFTQMARNTFSQASCVYEDQRGLMLANELGQAIVDFFSHFTRHDGLQWRIS